SWPNSPPTNAAPPSTNGTKRVRRRRPPDPRARRNSHHAGNPPSPRQAALQCQSIPGLRLGVVSLAPCTSSCSCPRSPKETNTSATVVLARPAIARKRQVADRRRLEGSVAPAAVPSAVVHLVAERLTDLSGELASFG